MTRHISPGTDHEIPDDLRLALTADAKALAKWEEITPLSRNEWICWTISVKRSVTRKDHVRRVVSELKEGIRRPCCWIGCVHRRDKPMNATQKWILGKRVK